MVMKWIGLTGGIASGKTTVANFFREMGVPVVDADRLAHAALSKNKDKIATYFGPDILDDSGEVDRKKLGQKVFQEPKNSIWFILTTCNGNIARFLFIFFICHFISRT